MISNPLILTATLQLRDIWLTTAEESSNKQEKAIPARVDVLSWLGRATLDVIGLAGTFSPARTFLPY